MPKTQTNCPNCKQPVIIDIQQVFDVSQDPLAKQKLLTNAVNFMQCPSCGYRGMVAIPIVYHDPEKELLLTFFPPDLNKTVNEQEQEIGPLINRILDKLPQEKRKAYLLQPQSMLTYQTLIEKILEADGITKEMIENQQKRIALIERLLGTSSKERVEIIKQEEPLIDVNFFTLLSRIVQSSVAQGDKESQEKLLELQQQLFENTKTGKKIYSQAKDTEKAIKQLQEAGKEGLTREKLLDLFLKAENEIQISTMASLARSGLDYSFFQLLSEKIDQTSEKSEREKLEKLRETLLEITEEIDKKMQAEFQHSRKVLEKILDAEDIEKAIMKNTDAINDFFIQNLENELKNARKSGNLERINKLEQVMVFIERATAPSEEIQLLEELLDFEDQNQLEEKVKANIEKITPEFISTINHVIIQSDGSGTREELAEKLKKVHRTVLRFSMLEKMKKGEQ